MASNELLKIIDNIECKRCSMCKEYLSFESFSKDKSQKTCLSSRCRSCNSKRSLKWQRDNPERVRENARKGHFRRSYGITLETYNALLFAQDYKCAICSNKLQKNAKMRTGKRSHNLTCVDHCHTSGEVRGILCHACNSGLGYFRDNTDNLESAIKYLQDRG